MNAAAFGQLGRYFRGNPSSIPITVMAARHKKSGYYPRMMKKYGGGGGKRRSSASGGYRGRGARSIPQYISLAQIIGEKKYLDTKNNSSSTITLAGIEYGTVAFVVPQGVTAAERIGQKARFSSLFISAEIINPATSDPDLTEETVRMVIVEDSQPNKEIPTLASVLTLSDHDSNVIAPYEAYRNLVNSSRFKILADKTWNFKALAGPEAQSPYDYPLQRFKYQKFVKWKRGCLFDYRGGTGGVDERTEKNVFIYWMSRRGRATLNNVNLRVRFTDS